MSKGRKINISVEEAFGIPAQKKGPDTINPTTDPLKKSNGGPISESLSPESLRILEETKGAKAGGAAIDKGSELFRLQGGTFSVDEAINYNANLAANQSFGEQVGNVTMNAIPTFAAGFLDNFNYDIPDMVGLVSGQEKEYGNWLTDITQSLRKAGDAPVYQEGDSLADPTYWAKQAQNFSYTAGLIAGTMVEQAAMTALTVESLGAAAPLQALSLGNKAKLFKNAAFGTWKGVQEGYINALETFEGTKKKYEGLGYSQEEAIKYASEAASIGYKMETGPLMVLNALQFGAIGKLNPFGKSAGVNTGFGGAVESALSPAFSRIAYKPLSKLVAGGVNIGSESVEEIIQTGVGRYAEHRQLSKTKDTFTDFEFWNNEMRDSAIGGAFGGGVFTVAGSVSDKIQDKKTGAVQGRIYDNFITNNKKRTEQHTIELSQAIQEGDVEKQRNIEFKMQRESVFEALKLDYTLKKETAFDSHIKTLEGALEAIQNKDVEALKKYGLLDEASIKNALQSFPRLIAQSNKIKETFLKNYEKSEDFTVAATLTDSQMVSDNSIRYIEENKKSVEEFKRKNFSGLSPQGQVHMNNLLRKEEIMIQAGINSISAAERTELESLEEMINTGDEGLSELDRNLFKTLDASEILNTYVENENLKKVQGTATERIEEWSKPGKAKEVKVNEAVQEIKKATSKEALVEVKETLEKENALTPKVEQVINAKIVEAEVNATVPPQEEGENFAEIERETGPPPNPVREETAQEINAIFEQLEAEYAETDNFTTLSDEQLFEPVDVSDMSDGLRSKMQKAVGQYYENLRTEKDNPSFSDFIQDFIKHNAKDSTDRIFNALVEGWKANGLQEADYAQVYANIFKNRKDIAFDILGIANEIIGEAPTVTEVASETKKVLEEVQKEAAPTVALNTNNEPVLKDTTPFRTSQATLKAAHLSMPYNREFVTDEDGNVTVVDTDDSTELLTGNDVNSMKLLNPDLFNPGTVLSVSIPPNYMNMKVSVWEDDITKGRSITFGEWMAKNNVTKGSPEWIAKVPMVATDQDGENVFMMHDTDWYNPVNVGLKDSPADQFSIIQEANLNLMNVRNKLQDVGQSFEITITVKRPGTWKLVDKNSPPITINQANPQTKFAIANKDGDLVIEANELLEKDDVNLLNTKKDFKDGHTYQIRRGVNKNEVIALQVFRNKLSEDAVNTVNGLVEAYLYQKDEGGSVSDFAKTKEVREQVLTATGLDVFNMRDFETLINMYIPTLRGKFGSPASVSIEVEKNPRIPNGTPYFVVQKGAFVFGVKGQEIVPGKKAYYIHPMKMKDEGGPAQMAFRLRKFTAMLPNATQNISKEGLSTDRNTVVIDKDKNVFPKESYREFLKNTLTTTVKSFNVGTKDKPVYATYVQPVINFEVTGESKVDVANPTPAKVEEIKVKMSEAKKANLSLEQKVGWNEGFSESEIEFALNSDNVEIKETVDNQGNSEIKITENGNYVGSITLSLEIEGYLGVSITVGVESQGKGISKHLYNLALASVKEKGGKGLYSIDQVLKTPEKSKASRANFKTSLLGKEDSKIRKTLQSVLINELKGEKAVVTLITDVSDSFAKKGAIQYKTETTEAQERAASEQAEEAIERQVEEGQAAFIANEERNRREAEDVEMAALTKKEQAIVQSSPEKFETVEPLKIEEITSDVSPVDNNQELIKIGTKTVLNSNEELTRIGKDNKRLSKIAKLMAARISSLTNRIVNADLDSAGIAMTNFSQDSIDENDNFLEGSILTDVAIDEEAIQTVVSAREDLADLRDETIVHEEIHRYTKALYVIKEAAGGGSLTDFGFTEAEDTFMAEIEELYQQYLETNNTNSDFAQPNTSIEEFITYGLTNAAFIAEIDGIKVENTSILDKLIAALSKLFGDKISIKQALDKSFENYMKAETHLEKIAVQTEYFTAKESVPVTNPPAVKSAAEIQNLKDSIAMLLHLGVSENAPEMQILRDELGIEYLDEPTIITSEDIAKMKQDVTGVPGLTIIQDFQVTDYVFNEVSKRIDFKFGTKVDKNEILKDVKSSYFDLLGPKQKNNMTTIANLEKMVVNSPGLAPVVERMKKEVQVYTTIRDNWKMIEKGGLDKVRKFTGIKETNDTMEVLNENGEVEKNYSKTSLEEGGKGTASYRLKRFLAGIKEVDANGTPKTGFLGVPTYVGFDVAYATIESVLSSPVEVDSSFQDMIVRLEENVKNHKWLRQVIEQLKSADEQIQNELVYNFTRHTLSMKFVMFSKNRDGTYSLKVYDTNSTEITRVIRTQWDSNLKNSPLVYAANGTHKINKDRAKFLLEQFEAFQSSIVPATAGNVATVGATNEQLKTWLEDFGIVLSEDTLNEMRTKQVTYMTKDGQATMNFTKLFKNSSNSDGVFGLLANYLQNIIEQDDTTLDENPQNHPFDNANNVLKTLAKIESKYSLNATTNSFRDGGKSIYGFTATKLATDLSKKLKATDSEYRAQLLEKSFNKHSHILKLLNSSESFRDKMQIDHLGITAMKELGKGTFGDNSLTGLSNSDHELTKLGLFQDREQGELKEFFDEAKFIGLRMARMFFPTMSDKSQMLMLQTAVLDLNAKHFTIVDGVATIKEQIAEAMYSQMVRPELERLTSFAARNEPTNIKGYDMAARMFLMIPELNNMVDADTGLRVIALMNQQPSVYNMEWFEEKIRPQAKEIITKLVANDSAKKIKEWEVAGFIETKNGVKSTKFLNQKYFNNISASTVEEKIQVAANDFVINSLISNANIHMVFSGDIASYSQDKIKQYFEDGNPIAPVAALKDGTIVGDKAYAMVSRDIISVNLGKRLALLLAPGNKIANSKGDKYTQIFLNDFFDITSNVPTLVELFYGKEESVKAAKIVSDYNATKDGAARKRLAKQLAADYPQLEDYFDIESTDAQEYTTLSEHINVLWRQGRLHSTQYEAMKAKAESGQNLTYEELRLVFQPIKPVHTGFRNEPGMDMMRMMYIKSSSYPLIPQLTKGLELDKLRLMLEDQEKKTGKKVRASYQSANKVGANNKAISIFNPDGTYNTELSDLEISEASLVLDRDNFRIQQDVPFKSAKTSTDKVSLGTQTLKLLFGDGMLDIDDFEMDGVKMSGKELYDKFVNDYDGYINLKKESLFKQLGVDKRGQPIDVEKTMDKLQKMLKIEAEERGYPKQDIEALKIVPKLDKDGNIIDVQFSIPLWLSPNSNRYEALLNAIVTTRLVNVKLPGSAYVLGTEAGYKMQEDFSGINKSNIVFTSEWQGELKAYEKGKLAQIFLPSKFRDNEGNLIDLMSDKYSYRDEDGLLKLREDMIDPKLLERTSFRIPTSAHVSMSQVVIAGFLPTEVGDLMILPKNFTKQKGIDFDVDKETTYHLHTYMDADGKMRAFDEDARQETLKKFDSQHNDDTAEAKLIREIFGDDVNFLDDEFEPGEKLDKINDKLKEKIFENELVKIHAAVLSNHNPEVQRKINKVLSMDFATKQAELIQKELKGDQDDTYFTMLSDSYHKSKVELGAAGKLGIGVYSNYVVFHSMIQQSSKPIQLKTRDGEGGLIPLKVTIGKQTSNGMLGGKNSLAQGVNKRSIAEVFAERQNTATDNEKEQIMGRVNVNEVTINVDSLLSALGFDKDTLDDGSAVSLPYLFLSQPIIRDFVEALRKTNSNTTEFSSAAREIVINELKQKYISETDYNAELVPQMMTGQTLFNNLNTPSNMIQLEVLEMFLGLDKYAKNIALLQGRMNITGSGLGKSFFETIDKHYALQNIIKDNEANKSGIIIGNASNLIGDYIKKDSIEPEHVGRDFASEGYVDLGSYWIKPNNPIGSMLVNSVDTGYNLWKDFFPFDDYFIKQVMDEIRKEVSSEDASSTKVIETQQNIFKEMKKFFVTSQLLEVINGDPGVERQRLFIDTEGKQSLPNYMNEVVRGTSILKSNKLLSRFQYTINKNGLPSLIKFDNTKGENFDEDYLYLSLIELMEAKEALPDFQGKPYDTEMLAKDLIAYNYLEGGIQEAVQFSKYISISYLNTIKFAGFTREWNGKFRPGVFNKILGIRQDDKPSVFTRQYVQNTPQKLTKVDPKTQIMDAAYTGNNKDLGNLVEFALNEKALTEVEQATFAKVNFVTIYNSTTKKGLKKFQVYERSNDKFRRISTLGVFGMAEYSIGQESMGSVVNDSFRHASPPAKAIVKKVAQPKVNNAIDLDNMSGKEIIATVANFDFVENPHLKAVAQAIMPYLPDSLEFKTDDLVVNGVRVARGRYNVGENLITIDKLYLATATSEDLAKTILHETIHALTAKYINQHIDIKTGEFLSENPPKEIVDLVLLFNETKRKLGPEIEAYAKKRQDQLAGRTTEGTTERERTVAYGGTNIKEFVTLVMTEPNFQKEMMDTIYKQSDKNLLEKLADIVKNILHTVLGESFNKDGVTSQGILASMQIIESQYAGEIDIDTTAAEANRLMDLMVEQLAQGGPPAFNPDEFENKPPEVTFEPTDFIWRFNKKKNLNYVVEGNFPLSMNLVDKVKAGEQSITIRNPKYKNSEGIYNVDGTNLAISRVGNKPVTIGEMKAKGYTEAEILKAFKGGTIADIREQSVKDWFNGIGTKNIYFVKDVTNKPEVLLEPSEYVIFDENQVSIVLHANEMHFIKTKDGKFYMTSESQDLRQITKETFDLASNDPAFDTFGILDKEERLSFIGGLNSLTRSMYQGELGTPLFRIPFKCN
tara:strand:- start:58957 stop:72993 length:14037 start_codon:yes stop_codon:yes gene_type:complete